MSVLTTGPRALLAAAALFVVVVLLLATPPATADFNSTSGDEHSTVGGSPNAVVAADFNQDGLDDLAATTNTRLGPDAAREMPFGVTVLLSKPDGTYGPGTYYPLGVQVQHQASTSLPCCPLAEAGELGAADLTVADVNGDPFMDLVAVNAWDDSASILVNTGTGRFGPAVSNPPPPDDPVDREFPPPDSSLADIKGSAPHAVAAGDLDGDGDEDLVTANAHSDNVSVLLNVSSPSDVGSPETGVYQEKSDSPYTIGGGDGPRGVAIADLDGDGDDDVVTANKNSDDVSVLLNNGSGGLATVKGPFGVGTDPTGVATEQLDSKSNSYPDVVVPNSGDDNVSVLLNDGVDSLLSSEASSPYSVGSAPVDVVVRDLGGSGNEKDIAVANRGDNNVTVRRGDGTGDFSTVESNSPYTAGGPPASLTSGNFDPPSMIHNAAGAVSPNPNDIDPDLAAANSSGITVLHNE